MKFVTTLLCFAIALVADEAAPRPAPELAFTLPPKVAALLSHYRGKVVALEFIMTTCPHCQAAAKVMTALQERYGRQGFQALDVAVDADADQRVANFAREHGAHFPVGWTSLNQMMAFMGFSTYPLVPQLVLIDRRGIIRFQTPRLGDSESLKEPVLDERVRDLLR